MYRFRGLGYEILGGGGGGALFSLHGAPKLPETPLLTVQVAGFGAVLQTLLGVAIWCLPEGVGPRLPRPRKRPRRFVLAVRLL